MNRNDDGDLFRDEVLVDPAHLGGRLTTLDYRICGGVVHADESGSGQSTEHRHGRSTGRHPHLAER